jgi:hypothetical protein
MSKPRTTMKRVQIVDPEEPSTKKSVSRRPKSVSRRSSNPAGNPNIDIHRKEQMADKNPLINLRHLLPFRAVEKARKHLASASANVSASAEDVIQLSRSLPKVTRNMTISALSPAPNASKSRKSLFNRVRSFFGKKGGTRRRLHK